MKSFTSSAVRRAQRALTLTCLLCLCLLAQTNVLTVAPSGRMPAKRNTTVTATVHAQLREGYHANSNTPSEDYLIPLKLTWNAAPLEVVEVKYPEPKMEKYQFSAKPLSVFSGGFDITTKFSVPAKAPNGPAILTGKLRYQACTDKLCLPPKTIEVPLTVDIQ